MPRVEFTANLKRHVDCPVVQAAGATVREVLDAAFRELPKVQSYVLDEHGALRKHMAIFVDGELIADRERLSDPVAPTAEIYVLQALSGG